MHALYSPVVAGSGGSSGGGGDSNWWWVVTMIISLLLLVVPLMGVGTTAVRTSTVENNNTQYDEGVSGENILLLIIFFGAFFVYIYTCLRCRYPLEIKCFLKTRENSQSNNHHQRRRRRHYGKKSSSPSKQQEDDAFATFSSSSTTTTTSSSSSSTSSPSSSSSRDNSDNEFDGDNTAKGTTKKRKQTQHEKGISAVRQIRDLIQQIRKCIAADQKDDRDEDNVNGAGDQKEEDEKRPQQKEEQVKEDNCLEKIPNDECKRFASNHRRNKQHRSYSLPYVPPHHRYAGSANSLAVAANLRKQPQHQLQQLQQQHQLQQLQQQQKKKEDAPKLPPYFHQTSLDKKHNGASASRDARDNINKAFINNWRDSALGAQKRTGVVICCQSGSDSKNWRPATLTAHQQKQLNEENSTKKRR